MIVPDLGTAHMVYFYVAVDFNRAVEEVRYYGQIFQTRR
jgi:hypothetical protein